MSSYSSANSSLRPAWQGNQSGGRGFQPPPTVSSERGRTRPSSFVAVASGSSTTTGNQTESRSNVNKFAALDDDEDAAVAAAAALVGSSNSENNNSRANNRRTTVGPGNSRSDALRAPAPGTTRSTSMGGKPAGRSLADLMARAPEPKERSVGYSSSGRFSSYRSATNDEAEAKVVRFTREKLLSMRTAPSQTPPDSLKELEGSVILSPEPQDPVCYDNFDAEAIWATVPRDRRVSKVGAALPGEEIGRRGSRAPLGGGRGQWERGVALPPPDSSAKKGREKEADNPSDLWDDPMTTGAATDFSAFGAMPEDDDGAFDFDKMAEATRKFEEELHGRSRASSDADVEEDLNAHSVKVDPNRPLASIGTTIRSGSGDHVNVFEDFEDPSALAAAAAAAAAAASTTESTKAEEGKAPETTKSSAGKESEEEEGKEQPQSTTAATESEPPPPSVSAKSNESAAIKGGDEDPSASSRLMAMIGVTRDPNMSPDGPKAVAAAWGLPDPVQQEISAVTGAPETKPASVVPFNPWDSLLPLAPPPAQGLDLQARLREAEMEQKAREVEMLRRRQQQEQEEAQRRAAALAAAQQQAAAEERARQQAAAAAAAQASMQQQAGVQTQVENVLMERISTILENSWGRADLNTILSTLHAEDARVIPLLNTIDALRGLILRNPQRVALRQDPAFGSEVVGLLVTNSQWQQQQAQIHAQQEIQRRQQEQQRQQQAQQIAARASQPAPLIPGAPWYYSDPQGNIQGPFRGEEMRQWLEAGYFKGDLPISQDSKGEFLALSLIFPDLSVAFKDEEAEREKARQESERAEAERLERERAQAQAEAEAKAKEAAEQRERERRDREQREYEQRERERLAREAAENKRREKERAAAEKAAIAASSAAKNGGGGNESSEQLKMMLGLQSHESPVEAVEPSQPVMEPPKATEKEKKKTKAQGKNQAARSAPKEVQPVESPVPAEKQPAPVPVPAPAPVWGNTSKPASRKSMSQIQLEEAQAAAMVAMQREGSRGSGSGWANVAASRGGSTGWSGVAAKPTPAIVITKNSTAKTPATSGTTAARPSSQQIKAVAEANAQVSQRHSQNTGAGSSADEFGAKMSPSFEKWCRDQMQKLNGTDDLTLASFCMTLSDPMEIRQYLTTYLGATPQVNTFATEFINRKIGKKEKQEEWETTAGAKKSRKKKSGGR